MIFAVFLVVIGIGSGFYLLTFFGLLVLIPVLLSPSRPTTRPQPPSTQTRPREQPRRIAPPPVQPYATATPPEQPAAALSPIPPPSAPSTAYSGALFPTSMFPPMSQMGTIPPQVKEGSPKKPEERDELVEVGTILALLKLAFG